MPRQGRIHLEGGIYHVIQRGLERGVIFRDDTDREEFIKRLAAGLRDTDLRCYAWSLMPNHFHLLLRAGTKPIGTLMRKLQTGYAMYYNRRYKRSGYLYQNRYKSILCQEESYMLELVRYIHLNPLRAKIVKSMEELNDYRWCGHSAIIKGNNAEWYFRDEILERFGQQKNEAIKRYIEFISSAKDSGRREEFTGGGLRRSAGGWSGVLALKRAKEYHRSDERVIGDGGFVEEVLKRTEEEFKRKEKLRSEGWDLKKISERVCRVFSIDPGNINKRGRSNNISQARQAIMYLANKELGISGTEIAKYFGITGVAVSKGIRLGEQLAKERNLKLIS